MLDPSLVSQVLHMSLLIFQQILLNLLSFLVTALACLFIINHLSLMSLMIHHLNLYFIILFRFIMFHLSTKSNQFTSEEAVTISFIFLSIFLSLSLFTSISISTSIQLLNQIKTDLKIRAFLILSVVRNDHGWRKVFIF